MEALLRAGRDGAAVALGADVTLLAVGIICLLVALGHAAIGVLWVLPRLDADSLPRTPLGSPRMTDAMIRVTWHVVTIFVLAVGGLLLSLYFRVSADPQSLALRWFGVMWLAVAGVAGVVLVRSARDLLRRPFSILWMTTMTLLGVVLLLAARSQPILSMDRLGELGVVRLEPQRAFLVYNGGKPLALSNDAQHLGDRLMFCQSSQMFESPAHGEKFDILGRYYAGPARRGLDRYPVRVQGSGVYVDFERRISGPERGDPPASEPAGGFCTE